MSVVEGEGYAVGNVEDLGDGPGFRKIRRELGVTAFGANAILLPAGMATGNHFHDEQEELYFLHRGPIAIEFGDGSVHELGPGGLAAGRSRHGARDPRAGRRGRAVS